MKKFESFDKFAKHDYIDSASFADGTEPMICRIGEVEIVLAAEPCDNTEGLVVLSTPSDIYSISAPDKESTGMIGLLLVQILENSKDLESGIASIKRTFKLFS